MEMPVLATATSCTTALNMIDLVFLKALRDKLKGGNARSIHLNVLPGRFATRLDLADIDAIKPGVAEHFMQTLLTKTRFEFKLSYDILDLNSLSTNDQKLLDLLSKRLNALCIENEDNFKEHGIKTFGFGYPLIIKRSRQDPSRFIKAPLLIWPLDILKAHNKVNTWSIVRNKTLNENGRIVDEDLHSVSLNEVLISFLKTDENISIAQLNEELLEDAIIDEAELLNICIAVLQSLNAHTDPELLNQLREKHQQPIAPLPDSNWLESVTNNLPWIHFGGVFGLFRTQKESIITDLDRLIGNFESFSFENGAVETFDGTPYSAINTDPSQQEILNTLSSQPRKIIQGPPGTGKSQSLTALITNALANNLKCLVVCEKKTALDVIKNNLLNENEELGMLAAVIEDINKDRDGIVNSVRERMNAATSPSTATPISYPTLTQNLSAAAAALNLQHRQLGKSIYQTQTWTTLVGKYLHHQQHTDISRLKNSLDYKWFQFTDEADELNTISTTLREARSLYDAINTLTHPLEILHDRVFDRENISGAQVDIEQLATDFIAKAPPVLQMLREQLDGLQLWKTNEYVTWPYTVHQAIQDWLPKLSLLTHHSALLPSPFELEETAREKKKELQELNAAITDAISSYEAWLKQHYADYHRSVSQATAHYFSFIEENNSHFGKRFLKNDDFTKFITSLLSVFSGKYKKLKENKPLVITNIEVIRTTHETYNYVEHTYLQPMAPPNLQIYVDNICLLHQKATAWYDDTHTLIRQQVSTILSNNLHPVYDNREAILQLEIHFEQLYHSLSTTASTSQSASSIQSLHDIQLIITGLVSALDNILQAFNSFRSYYTSTQDNNRALLVRIEQLLQPYQENTIFRQAVVVPVTTRHAQPYLQELLAHAQLIIDNSDTFRDYYHWRNYLNGKDQLNRQVLTAMIQSGCPNWGDAFECWYLNWLLSANENRNLPKNEDRIQVFLQLKNQLRKAQVKSILANWQSKQYDAYKRMHQSGISAAGLFNKKGGKGERRNSLRKIIQTDLDLFTDYFPVLMVSPTVCSSVLPLKEGIFDMVIFDEASQLRLEDTFPALLRGKIRIVSGDNQQMPPTSYFQGGNAILSPGDEDEAEEEMTTTIPQKNKSHSLDLADSESLLAYAENIGYKQSYLKIHYRSQHPALIDFSNHAFYGKRLIPMPAKTNYIPIQFIEVNGIYENQVNREEAKQVVDTLLHRINSNPDGTYPSIGIATFNIYQRNLILEEITKVRQKDPAYDKKINDLGSDLFVKNLENIQGDERDIIIISTTFGKKTDGSFRQHFGPILQSNGYKLLNVIITRAKYKIFVCTSIPTEWIRQYPTLLQQQKNNGRAAFYAYLAYAKAVSERDDLQRLAILQQLFDNCETKAFDVAVQTLGFESPFEEEVFHRLAEKIGPNRLIHQYAIGGFRIDLIIKSATNDQPLIAIECDGTKYHNSQEAYAWDVFRQQQVEQYGLTFYRIWSTNWWISPDRELNKLVTFIQAEDTKEKAPAFKSSLFE